MRPSILVLATVATLATAAPGVRSSAATRPRPKVQAHVHAEDGDPRAPSDRYPASATDRREEIYSQPAGGKVVVDDVAGDIRVRAGDGNQVRLVAVARLQARTAADLELARREMPVQLSQHGDTVVAFVDSPTRDAEGNLRGPWRDLPYRVIWDFELEVPRRTDLVLRTVLDGKVEVEGTEGEFEVRNVNGAVTLQGVAGGGSASTVNGELIVRFRRNPAGPCDFSTVNGDVDVTLQVGLAADVRFRTLNGEAWSDFPFTTVPVQPSVSRERGEGRFVIKSDWQQGIRIGAGGPQLSFATVNGQIYIRRAGGGVA